MSDISIIGAGSWGTALSVVLHKNGHKITIWSALAPEIEMLKESMSRQKNFRVLFYRMILCSQQI